MVTRQKLVSFGIPTLAVATIVGAALLHKQRTKSFIPPPPDPITTIPSSSGGHEIDVVFAIDTTGSMGGLLDGAKRTAWSIASHIRQTDPNANLRIGLVAYKDIHDEYSTKPFQLTTDLDAVYGELSSYTAAGGGDVPENVDGALDDSLHKMAWRKGAKKLIFVVGDAPPAGRPGIPSYDSLAREAAASGIIINTIRCGWDSTTQVAFARMAELGGGEFSTIQQDGGVHQVATPYDDRLADLSARIDGTTIVYGDEGVRTRYREKMAKTAVAPAPAKADRAGYYAKGGLKRTDEDLVGAVATGSVTIEAVPEASLPADLKGKSKDEIKAEVDKRIAERRVLQEQVKKLAKEREEYLSKQARDGEGGFDAKVKSTVERQLKK
jgi:hypothetical protein